VLDWFLADPLSDHRAMRSSDQIAQGESCPGRHQSLKILDVGSPYKRLGQGVPNNK
jgi:hypothetical protein